MKTTAQTAAVPPGGVPRISGFKRNCMGTMDFDGKFQGMRKAQSFIVYPLHAGSDASHVKVQSGTRIGHICLKQGHVTLSPAVKSGAYNQHLAQAIRIDQLSAEELFTLKAHVFDSANGKAGTNKMLYTDNSAALEVFG